MKRESLGKTRIGVDSCSKANTNCVLLLVLLLALSLRLGLARFYLVGGDLSGAYYPPALALIGELDIPFQDWDLWYIRLGVVLPLSLFHLLTGRADIAIPLAALPFSMLQVCIVYLIGRRLWDENVGVLAALLEATYPVSVMFGAKVLPDTQMACSLTAAMLFFVYGRSQQSRSYLLLAGICVGLGYLGKITALFWVVVLSGFWLFQRRTFPRWSFLTVALGMLLVLAFETLVLSLLNNGFCFRPMNLLEKSEHFLSINFYDIGVDRYIPGFFAGLLWPVNSGFVFHGLMGVAVFGVAIFYFLKIGYDARFSEIVWWWLGLFLCLNFACIGFSQPVVTTIQMRYLMFITPASCLIIAVGLGKLNKPMRIGITSFLVISSLICSYCLYSTWKPHDAGCQYLYKIVRNKSEYASTIFFNDRRSANYTKLVVGGGRNYIIVEESAQFKQARPGDLSIISSGGYIKEDSRLESYRNEIQKGPWKKVDEWKSEERLVYSIFKALKITIKKGFHRQIKIYRRQHDQ